MKKVILLIAAVVLAMGAKAQSRVESDSTAAAATVSAPQSSADDEDDEEDDEPNVIGGKVVSSRHDGEANVLGMPVYYDTLGRVIEGDNPSPSGGIYSRPRHHYLNDKRNVFCPWFAEAVLTAGLSDVALGATFTYLPNRWGAYGSVRFGLTDDYLVAGAALRLSGASDEIDWHLYGGVMFGHRDVGVDFGMRMALPRQNSALSLTSATMGLSVIDGDVFLTVGASLYVMGLSALSWLLWW